LVDHAESAKHKGNFVGLRADVRKLLASAAAELGEVRIVVHEYAGRLELERFTIQLGGVVTPEALVAAKEPIELDRVYTVRAGSTRPA
jgi:hypothetical protein